MTSTTSTHAESLELAAARDQDEAAFGRLVGPYRPALQAHCYRMLGSVPDAEDAVQESLLRAWRGIASFEGRSTLRSWLYTIATNVCLKLIERRPKRVLPIDVEQATVEYQHVAEPVAEIPWIGPIGGASISRDVAPEANYESSESVELAFIAALQHLPANQRAVLLLRDVLGFAPAEIAATLETTPAAVSSALQRAHLSVEERMPAQSQQQSLRALGDGRVKEIVNRWVSAWEASDVPQLVAMLSQDATFSMPPRPMWLRGRETIAPFLARYPFSHPGRWRLTPIDANGQIAFAVWERFAGSEPLLAHGIMLLDVDPAGQLTDVTTFQGAEYHAHLGLALSYAE